MVGKCLPLIVSILMSLSEDIGKYRHECPEFKGCGEQ